MVANGLISKMLSKNSVVNQHNFTKNALQHSNAANEVSLHTKPRPERWFKWLKVEVIDEMKWEKQNAKVIKTRVYTSRK